MLILQATSGDVAFRRREINTVDATFKQTHSRNPDDELPNEGGSNGMLRPRKLPDRVRARRDRQSGAGFAGRYARPGAKPGARRR